jgi:hypothetical protein
MERFTLSMIVVMLTVIMFVSPAAANPVIPTLTKFYFTENGKPVDSPVNFSLDCYGTYSDWIIRSATTRENAPGQDLVISISETCLPGGCSVFDFNNPWLENVSSCVFEGSYKGKPFVVRDFKKQYDGNWFWVDDTDAEVNGTYAGIKSSDSNACGSSFDSREDQCNQLYNQHGSEDIQEKNRQCWIEAYDKSMECKREHTSVINLNKSEERNTPSRVVSAFAEYHIAISSESSPANGTVQIGINSTPHSPIASLYCALMNLFGVKC